MLNPIQNRPWTTYLTQELINSIQKGHLGHSYKGESLLKNPFDLSIYTQLLYDVNPQTIIEIGSYKGASACWLSDMTYSLFNKRTPILSIDINPVALTCDDVQFIIGDANNLELVLDNKLSELKHPILVIEDSNHQPSTSLKVLEYFHNILHVNDYIVVEDSIVLFLPDKANYDGYGPALAIDTFLRKYPDNYIIDSRYCDHYGYNVTWNTNGYLRRVK